MYQIDFLDHRQAAVAQKIHAAMVLAHAQEAALMRPGQPAPPERSADAIQACSEHFLGALLGDEIVGSLSLGLDDEPGQIRIFSLSVHPDHQRQGLARALVTRAIQLGNQAPISVMTAATNHPALGLYTGLGFEQYRRGLTRDGQIEMLKLRWLPPKPQQPEVDCAYST